MNSRYNHQEFRPFAEAKTDTVTGRTDMLMQCTVRNVETTKIHTIVTASHGHVPSIAEVQSKSHWTHLEVELFRFIVDLLAVKMKFAQHLGVNMASLLGSHDECMVTTFLTMSITRSRFSPRMNEEH